MSSQKSKKLDQIQKITLSVEETKEMIKYQMLQTLTHGVEYHGLMFFLEGEPGIGKTQIPRQVLKEMCDDIMKEVSTEIQSHPEYSYFKNEQKGQGHLEVINLAAKDAQDFSGCPIVDVKTKIQTFAHPDALAQRGFGIIFWDESNRVTDRDVKTTLLSIWMDRGVNGHYIGPGYIQVAAGNPFNDDRFPDIETPDDAFAERFRIIRVQPTISEVIAFLKKRYATHFLLSYLEENKDLCSVGNEITQNEAHSVQTFSPRTIDKAMEITFSLKDKPLSNQKVVSNLLKIYFGNSTALRIMKWLTNDQDISLDKIIKNPELAEKIQKSDMPLNSLLSNQVFKFIEKAFESEKPVSQKSKKAISLIASKLNNEALGLFLNNLTKHEKNEELFAYVQAEFLDILKFAKKVEDIF